MRPDVTRGLPTTSVHVDRPKPSLSLVNAQVSYQSWPRYYYQCLLMLLENGKKLRCEERSITTDGWPAGEMWSPMAHPENRCFRSNKPTVSGVVRYRIHRNFYPYEKALWIEASTILLLIALAKGGWTNTSLLVVCGRSTHIFRKGEAMMPRLSWIPFEIPHNEGVVELLRKLFSLMSSWIGVENVLRVNHREDSHIGCRRSHQDHVHESGF